MSYFPQNGIPGLMPMRVIDSFEVVEIGHDHTQRLANSRAPLGFSLEQVHDGTSIPEPSQMVMSCLELQGGVRLHQRILQY